jgi:selenocysteine-specific elongation factor
MALVGVKASQADRGSVVVGDGNWKALRRFGARIEVPAASSREVDHGQRVRLFLGTAEVMARVRTEDRGLVRRGETTWVVLDCEQPVVARVGDRFILRFYSPVTTIAGGQVSELEPPRGWRERLGAWNEILTGDPEQSIIAAVNASGGLGLDSGDVPLASTASGSRAESMLEANSDVSRIGNAWYGRMAMEDAAAAVVNQLERAHEIRRRASAESLESVRASISVRYSVPLIDFAIESLTSTGAVVLRGPTIRLPGHEAELDAAEEAASRELVQILSAAGLAPPSPSEMTARIGVEREVLNDLLRLLVERKEIVSITPEMIVTRETEENARRVVRMIAGQGNPASPGDFRETLGVTRKYLIPLLEYMDRIGVTLRTSEGRIARDS